MKKILTVLLAVLMVLALAGCAKEEEETGELVKGEYYISNNTGKNIDGVYFYEAGSADKGTNYVEAAYNAGEMHYNYIQNFHAITVNAEDDAKFAEITVKEGDTTPHFVFEVTVDGETYAKFDNLALEVADIVLIPAESVADYGNGATQIAWGKDFADGYTMTVNFYNSTGLEVTSLKAYNSETGAEVADILADLGLTSLAADDTEAHAWTHVEDIKTANTIHYLIEWTMSNGETLTLGKDDSHALSFENTAMQLLKKADMADYNNGATTVVWLAPSITPVTPSK